MLKSSAVKVFRCYGHRRLEYVDLSTADLPLETILLLFVIFFLCSLIWYIMDFVILFR